KWCTCSILTPVSSSDGIFLIVLDIEIPLQIINDLLSNFGKAILFHQGKDSSLNRGKDCRKFQNSPATTVFKCFFLEAGREHRQEHPIKTNRSFNDIWHIIFTQL